MSTEQRRNRWMAGAVVAIVGAGILAGIVTDGSADHASGVLVYSLTDQVAGPTFYSLSIGSDPSPVTDLHAAATADFSPDGSRVAWISPGAGDSTYITVADADGANATEFGLDLHAAGVRWMPNGEDLAYTKGGTTCCGIVVLERGSGATADIPGTEQVGTFWDVGRDGRFAWSDASGIFVLDADGGQRTQIVEGPVESPAWSPDGRSIAYVADADGNQRTLDHAIRIVDVASGNTSSVTSGAGATDSFPVWSSDGAWIAFGRSPAGWDPNRGPWGISVYAARTDGSGLIQLVSSSDTAYSMPLDWQS
jgi:Tol biopolymer transport system component